MSAAITRSTEAAADLRTEVEMLRAALARSNRLAMLGTLAGSIAHEFNNLLTPVMSYAEMAMEAPADRRLTAKALERAHQGCDKASRIAAAILAFAAERGGAEEADVAAAVRDALLCMAQDPARFGVELELKIEPGLRAAIGQVELQQVIMNLVLNALKAMRGRGGRLRISASGGEGLKLGSSTWNTGPVVIEVEDTGCGIEPERLGRVFEAFETRAAPGGQAGTGLGLTICKQLIQSAGGKIDVVSQVSVGTRFTLTLGAALRAA